MLAHLVLYANLDFFSRVDGFLLAGRKGTVSYKRDVANLQFDKGCSAVSFLLRAWFLSLSLKYHRPEYFSCFFLKKYYRQLEYDEIFIMQEMEGFIYLFSSFGGGFCLFEKGCCSFPRRESHFCLPAKGDKHQQNINFSRSRQGITGPLGVNLNATCCSEMFSACLTNFSEPSGAPGCLGGLL